ncbi:MAG: caspase family protein [Paracoccaceae bacterium]
MFIEVARLLAALLVLALPSAALADKRVALVIGNSAYEFVSKLPNPANDADDIAAALKRLGFSVTAAKDLDYNRMRLAVRDFGEAAADADMALVYFAGHGIEIGNTNYLIPVNAELKSDRDVEFEAIRLDAVIGALDASKGVKIVLVDACRNNPFLGSMTMTTATRSVGRGLARVDPGGVLVGYAARGGTVSLDGKGRNSPYAKAVLAHLEEPGLELGKMFRKVRDSVLQDTEGGQEPFTYGSLPGEDIFLVPPMVQASLAEPPPGVAGDEAGSAARSAAAQEPAREPEPSPEEKLFAAAKKLDTLRAWSMYFREFPDGVHRDEALKLEDRRFNITIWTVIANRNRLQVALGMAAPLDLSLVSNEVAAEVETWIGLTDSDAFAVQALLKREGFYKGPMDGSLGGGSREAIRAFQSANGLTPTGVVSRATAAALGLDLYQRDKAVKPDISSTIATAFRAGDLRDIGEDPRLVKAVEAYVEGKLIVYGYHGGHLYIAVSFDRIGDLGTIMSYIGLTGGHLATITSKEENDFVVDLIRRDPSFWDPYKKEWVSGPMIGLMQKPGSGEPSGGWEWVTGEPATFLPWAPDMPNNNDGKAAIGAFGHRHPDGPGRGKSDRWRWDDYVLPMRSYIIEIE